MQMNKRVAVVTGASSGIGKVAAKTLLQQGWRVIGLGRDPERCAVAEAEIHSEMPDAQFELIRADLALMADTARAANEVIARTDRIDVLLNNAGGMAKERVITSEGNEATFTGNHLGHFLLTTRLLPLLQATAATSPRGSVRIVNVSSLANESCKGLDWDDLQMLNNFHPAAAYCRVKFANILFTRELAKRLASDGIVAHAMHPGTVSSNFITHADEATQHFIRTQRSDVAVTPEVGADTLIWLATAAEPGNSSGNYFYQREESAFNPAARDEVAATRLWEESNKLVASFR
jgi:NAD(P)-dependent dehydrogenase (short-subunit alcohol dehydrogenase family)